MSVKSVAFINSAIDNSKALAKDRQNLRQKNLERQERTELFKIKKQGLEADLKEKELTGLINSQKAERERRSIKDFESLMTAQNKVDEGYANEANDNLMAREKRHNQIMTATLTQGPSGTTLSRTIKPESEKAGKITASSKIIGDLKNGGIWDEGAFSSFGESEDSAEAQKTEGRKEAIRYANSNLGAGWEKKYPEAAQAIEQNFGGEYSVGQIITNRKGEEARVTKVIDGIPKLERVK